MPLRLAMFNANNLFQRPKVFPLEGLSAEAGKVLDVTEVISGREASCVAICFCVGRLLSSHFARAYGTSRPVCERRKPSSITRAFAVAFRGAHWPMPTANTIRKNDCHRQLRHLDLLPGSCWACRRIRQNSAVYRNTLNSGEFSDDRTWCD